MDQRERGATLSRGQRRRGRPDERTHQDSAAIRGLQSGRGEPRAKAEPRRGSKAVRREDEHHLISLPHMQLHLYQKNTAYVAPQDARKQVAGKQGKL